MVFFPISYNEHTQPRLYYYGRRQQRLLILNPTSQWITTTMRHACSMYTLMVHFYHCRETLPTYYYSVRAISFTSIHTRIVWYIKFKTNSCFVICNKRRHFSLLFFRLCTKNIVWLHCRVSIVSAPIIYVYLKKKMMKYYNKKNKKKNI